MLSVDIESDLNQLRQNSAGKLVNWDREISFDRSNISNLYEARVKQIDPGKPWSRLLQPWQIEGGNYP